MEEMKDLGAAMAIECISKRPTAIWYDIPAQVSLNHPGKVIR
jgi:hypothetical protein